MYTTDGSCTPSYRYGVQKKNQIVVKQELGTSRVFFCCRDGE